LRTDTCNLEHFLGTDDLGVGIFRNTRIFFMGSRMQARNGKEEIVTRSSNSEEPVHFSQKRKISSFKQAHLEISIQMQTPREQHINPTKW
jgi:hypothetical protein